MARIHVDDEFRAAMKPLIGARWRDLLKALPAVLASDDPEAVHDLRIASRRLRAVMDAGQGVFPRQWYRRLHKEATSITAALGDVRDRDVLLDALRRARAQANAGEWLALDYLIATTADAQDSARETMRAFLAELDVPDLRRRTRRRFPSAGKMDRRRARRSA